MTPDELSRYLQRVTGHRCPVWPVSPPAVWAADPGDARHDVTALAADLGLEAEGGRVILTMDEDALDRALEAVADGESRLPPSGSPDPTGPIRWAAATTAEPQTRGELDAAVGRPTAAWAVWRAGPAGIDVPRESLRSLGEDNPLVAVLRARDQATRHGVPDDPRLAALVLQWPLVARAAAEAGRTRPAALHLEQVARAALSGVPGERTGARLAEATRIVLQVGLDAAGVHAPDRI